MALRPKMAPSPSRLLLCLMALAPWSPVNAQTAQCSTLAGGCDGGKSHDTALKAAIAKFNDTKIYGGGVTYPVVFSSSNSGSSLASVSYSCTDGSIPPPLTGASAKTMWVLCSWKVPTECGLFC